MSAAAAAEAPAPAKGKKKLILMLAIVGVLVAGGGGAAVFMMKKKAAAEAEAEDGGADHAPAKKAAAPKHDPKAVPAFVPLDPFTVNLADREADRYAQIGITLEIEDAKLADQIKNYMPAIRNNILMAMADRTAGELMGRDGKAKLAEKVRKEASKAMGYEVDEDDEEADDHAAKSDPKAKKTKKNKAAADLPIKAVHFSNFIIQ
ncbi:MAG: flagellar protein FliL [Pseudomonadota bacterium]